MFSLTSATAEKIRQAFALLQVNSFHELSLAYTAEDQKLMKQGRWDDRNPDLLTNQIKEILGGIYSGNLAADDQVRWREIMWFWHHQAVGVAIWRGDRALARFYASKALGLQLQDHSSQITLLVPRP